MEVLQKSPQRLYHSLSKFGIAILLTILSWSTISCETREKEVASFFKDFDLSTTTGINDITRSQADYEKQKIPYVRVTGKSTSIDPRPPR